METPPPCPTPDAGTYDAIILGAGPAGLAAAVYLGRYLRPTLVLNEKRPSSRWHRPIAHNVLGYPAGIHRNQLLDWGRSHVALYPSVQFQNCSVTSIQLCGDMAGCQGGSDGTFLLTDDCGNAYRSRSLLLAPGIEYQLPDIPDVLAYAGRSLFHCPDCDGYKVRNQPIVVIGNGRGTAEMALLLTTWTSHVSLCTHGDPPDFDPEALQKLAHSHIDISTHKITAIEGNPDDGLLSGFLLDDGQSLPAAAAFSNVGCAPPIHLFHQLPLELHKDRWIKVDHRMRTNIPRCYAAGDVIAFGQTQLSVAMGSGATAAIWLHKELLPPHLCLTDRDW